MKYYNISMEIQRTGLMEDLKGYIYLMKTLLNNMQIKLNNYF